MKTKRVLMTFWLYVIGIITLYAQPHPSQLWQDTTLLYQTWDSALDTTNYTSAEKSRQKQINERLGHEWVLSYYPIQDAQEFGDLNRTLSPQERYIDFEDITPYTWKWILLRTPEGRIHLRRPNWWLKLHQVEKGKPLALSMPEMQLNVVGQVEQILPNLLDSRFPPAPRDGDYAWLPITAWMERMAPEVWSYVFSSGDTIKATPNHPVFSKSRERFVAIGELSFGEEVLNKAAIEITLAGKSRLSEVQVVNNLEVWRGHTFVIGKGQITVHNTYTAKFVELLPTDEDIAKYKGKVYENLVKLQYDKIKQLLPEYIPGESAVVYLRNYWSPDVRIWKPKVGITARTDTSDPLVAYYRRYSAFGKEDPLQNLRLLIVVPKDYAVGIEQIFGDLNIKKYGSGVIHRGAEHVFKPGEEQKIKDWLDLTYPNWKTIWDIKSNGF